MKFGCCPRAGNFFKFIHFPDTPVLNLRILLVDILTQAKPEPTITTKLKMVDECFERIQILYDNPKVLRKTTGKSDPTFWCSVKHLFHIDFISALKTFID